MDPTRNGEYAFLARLGPLGFKTVFDVGANDGDHAVVMREHFPDADIYMFELDADIFSQLETRFAQDPKAHAINKGLSDTDGEIEYFFNSAGNHSGTTMFYDKDVRPNAYTHEKRTAIVQPGHSFCTQADVARIDFLKVDTEGADCSVLKGFEPMLAKQAVGLMQFEYNFHAFNARVFLHDIFKLLKSNGYAVGKMYPEGIHFQPYSVGMEGQASMFVACPEADTALIDRISYTPPDCR